MAEKIDDITVEYQDTEGNLLTRELDKEILTRGSWTTIMFLYQDIDRSSGKWAEPKVSIRRYRKSGGVFRQQSKFNISNKKQGLKIADVLLRWYGEEKED